MGHLQEHRRAATQKRDKRRVAESPDHALRREVAIPASQSLRMSNRARTSPAGPTLCHPDRMPKLARARRRSRDCWAGGASRCEPFPRVAIPPDHDIARAPAGVHSPVARLTDPPASSRAASFRRRDRLGDGRVDVGGAHVIFARASSGKRVDLSARSDSTHRAPWSASRRAEAQLWAQA
jgi:hypothetical protein